MGYATHLGPIRFGTVKENAGFNCGSPVLVQSATLANTNTTAKNLFILPAGSQVLYVTVDVITAFNDTGTDLVDIGSSSSGALFVSALSVASTGHTVATLVAANLATITNIGTTDMQVTATYTGANADSSAGSALITVGYVMRNVDGTTTAAP
jgi:hypothetical protein